jgi:hypothetical protein
MNCEEFVRGLEELDDNSAPSPALEAHRRSCPSCSELMEDLAEIRLLASQMLPVEQPHDRVWQQIRQRMEKDGLIAETTPRRFFGQAALGWLPRMGMGMAYALVFLVALGVVYVYSVLSPRVAPPALPAAPNPPFAQLFEKVTPEKRALYESNLNQVDSSIQQWRTFLAAHPEDPFARQELFSTYQQKTRLWEALVRSQEF